MATLVPRQIVCPACHGPLSVATLVCTPCGLRIEGQFQDNEFATLGTEHLHFLRIFVHCEGRIRDMEAALGVSYPTIKAKVAALKVALSTASQSELGPPNAELVPPPTTPPVAPQELPSAPTSQAPAADGAHPIARLQSGQITVEQAIRLLKGKGRTK